MIFGDFVVFGDFLLCCGFFVFAGFCVFAGVYGVYFRVGGFSFVGFVATP